MALSPAQLATTWTWFGTGVSTIVKEMPKDSVKKAAVSAAKKVIKTVA